MADKRMKAQGQKVGWFDLYAELKVKLESRIFELGERVKELEAVNRTRTDMRIGGSS